MPPTVHVSRSVRFCVNPAVPLAESMASPRSNTFAGWPSLTGVGTFCELLVTCRGQPDARTGYLVNITVIDDAVRQAALPIVHHALATDPAQDSTLVLRRLVGPLRQELGEILASVTWQLTPYHSITMSMTDTDHVVIRQQFEFAAAHLLHCDSLTAEENRATFGKCNNPHSHGHNYRLEVAIESPLTTEGASIDIRAIEELVNKRVIQRLDHKNLNVDVPEFAEVNPSVENIARICYEFIQPSVEQLGGTLAHVTVWETEKTSCTYGR